MHIVLIMASEEDLECSTVFFLAIALAATVILWL
jgi:hypothetical protein